MKTARPLVWLLTMACFLFAASPAMAQSNWPNFVKDIADDGENLWLATDRGLVKMAKDSFTKTYYSFDDTGDDPENPLDWPQSVAVSGDSVWVGMYFNGLRLFDGVTWTHPPVDTLANGLGRITDILVIPDDGIWFTMLGRIVHNKNDVWTWYEAIIVSSGASTAPGFRLARDQRGRLWAGTDEWPGQPTETFLFSLSDGVFVNDDRIPAVEEVYGLAVAPDTTLWVCVGGIGVYALKDSVVTAYTQTNSGLPFIMNALAFDRDGHLWMGGYDNGVAVFDGATWTTYHSDQYPSLRGAYCIHCDSDGLVWVGTVENGLVRFDGTTWTQYDVTPGIDAVEEETPQDDVIVNVNPNPFNPVTTISYAIPEAGRVTLAVYSVTGQKVTTLVDELQDAGSHSATFDGKGLASGVYLYRLETVEVVRSGRMVLMK